MVDIQSLWSGLDTALILLYFAGIIAVGILMRGKAGKSMKSFFRVPSRRLTIPILIGVGAASWEDSWSIVGAAECGTTMGVCILFFYLIPTTIMKLPLALWIGPRVREKFPDWVVTMPDLMSYLYDNKTKLVVALGILPQMFYDSALLVAGGQVIAYVTGINMWLSFALLGLICIVYTSLSGLWGLALTDMIQFVIMTVAAGTLCLGIYNYYGGFGPLFSQAAAVNPDFVTISGGNNAMGVKISGMAGKCGGNICKRTVVSAVRIRKIRCRSQGRIFIHHTVRSVFHVDKCFRRNGCTDDVAPELAAESPAEAFWAVVFTTLPIGLRGLFVASLLAAVMSTVSADYLVGGAAISHDIVKGFINKNMTDKGDLMGTRIAVWAIGVAMIFCTYFWEGGIQKAWYYVGGFSVAAFIVLLCCSDLLQEKNSCRRFLEHDTYYSYVHGMGVHTGMPLRYTIQPDMLCIQYSSLPDSMQRNLRQIFQEQS